MSEARITILKWARGAIFSFGPFTFDTNTGVVSCSEPRPGAFRLTTCRWGTNYPYDVLRTLAARKGSVVQTGDLCESVFGTTTKPDALRLGLKIFLLRSHLDRIYPNGGNHIATHWGVGYSLSDTPVLRGARKA
jgi:DNA-binding response OmpR family regulator